MKRVVQGYRYPSTSGRRSDTRFVRPWCWGGTTTSGRCKTEEMTDGKNMGIWEERGARPPQRQRRR